MLNTHRSAFSNYTIILPLVDFILRLGAKLIGIEVKSGKKARRSGIKAFQENFYPTRMLLVGKGGLPWEEFLRMRVGELF